MAGKPKRRAMVAELERRTREEYEELEKTHLDYIIDWTADGGTLTKLLTELSGVVGSDVKRGMLMRYLEDTFGAGVEGLLAAARIAGAHALVEDAVDTVDDVSADKDQIARAKLQAEMRQWLAGKWNKRDYGEPKAGVAVQVNLGGAFLDSLRRQAERGRLEVTRARAFSSDGAEGSAHLEASSAIVGAIAPAADEVSFEVIES